MNENPAFTGHGLFSNRQVSWVVGEALLSSRQRASSRESSIPRVRYSTRLASRLQGKLDWVSVQAFTGWRHCHCLAHGHAYCPCTGVAAFHTPYIYIQLPSSALKSPKEHFPHHDGPCSERHLPQALQSTAWKLDTSFSAPHQATMAVSISIRRFPGQRTEHLQRHAGVPVKDDTPRIRSKGILPTDLYLIQPRH